MAMKIDKYYFIAKGFLSYMLKHRTEECLDVNVDMLAQLLREVADEPKSNKEDSK